MRQEFLQLAVSIALSVSEFFELMDSLIQILYLLSDEFKRLFMYFVHCLQLSMLSLNLMLFQVALNAFWA